MKEQNSNEKKKSRRWSWKAMNKEKRFYLLTAIGCAAVLVAIVIVAVAITNSGNVNNQAGNNSSNISASVDSTPEDSGSDDPVIVLPEGMIMPLETVAVSNEYGFFHNKTLNAYYEHVGIDFAATVGTEVYAVDAGTVESIYKDDLLSGTEIVVNHGDGLKTVYRFVTEAEGLKVGDKVAKGDVIATVAEANGDEYKDGAHLHFEILKNNKNVDPATYLTLEEK